MATWMAHLRIADSLFKQFYGLQEREFIEWEALRPTAAYPMKIGVAMSRRPMLRIFEMKRIGCSAGGIRINILQRSSKKAILVHSFLFISAI